MSIQTARLQLVPATAATLRMELARPLALSRALSCTVPANWPPDEIRDALEWFAQDWERQPDNREWSARYWIADDPVLGRILVGSGGFKGRAGDAGTVEIGYSVLPQFRGRGYATEAVAALTAWAVSQPGVDTVIADACPDNAASLRVLEKCGFVDCGAGAEPPLRRLRFVPQK